MSFPAHGPSRHPGDALDRRDDALYRTRRIMVVVAGGAVTASVALGVVFASELPGHAAPATAQPAAGSPAGTGSPSQAGAGSQGAPSASQGGASQSQPAASSAPPAPAPAPPQVVSGGS